MLPSSSTPLCPFCIGNLSFGVSPRFFLSGSQLLLISSRTVDSGPGALGYSNLATKTHPFVLDNCPTQTQTSVAMFEVQRVHPDLAGHVLEFSIVRTTCLFCLCKLRWKMHQIGIKPGKIMASHGSSHHSNRPPRARQPRRLGKKWCVESVPLYLQWNIHQQNKE